VPPSPKHKWSQEFQVEARHYKLKEVCTSLTHYGRYRPGTDGDVFMSKADEYRRDAADTLDLAQRASSTTDKTRLLIMADAWLDLADRAHKFAGRKVEPLRELHPLLRSKPFNHGSEAE
jgi:hypothetical protein